MKKINKIFHNISKFAVFKIQKSQQKITLLSPLSSFDFKAALKRFTKLIG